LGCARGSRGRAEQRHNHDVCRQRSSWIQRRRERGETLLAFLTGLGEVNPGAAVSFSGLAPGFIGPYQVNFIVAGDAPTGAVDVVVSAAGTAGNTAKLEIR
jgi:hypothetical protein